jgi:hypothetical protein
MVPRGFDNHLGSDVQPRLPLNWTMARQARNGLDNLFLHELHNSNIPGLISLASAAPIMYKPHQTLDPNRNPTPTAQVRGPQPGKGRKASRDARTHCTPGPIGDPRQLILMCHGFSHPGRNSPPKPKTRDAHMQLATPTPHRAGARSALIIDRWACVHP